jgi:hypothetical protein
MRASVVFLRRTGALYGDNARDRMQGPQAPFLMADPAASRLEYPLHPGTRTTPNLDAAIPEYRGTGALRAAHFGASDLEIGGAPASQPDPAPSLQRVRNQDPSFGIMDARGVI